MAKRIISGVDDLITLNAKLGCEWDYERNEIDPTTIAPNSHIKAHWVCEECGNRWEAQVKSRNRGNGCPVCGRKKGPVSKATAKAGESLADLRSDLLAEWDFEANAGIDPFKINLGTKRKISWICKKGHTWIAAVNKRVTRNQGCPVCYGTTKTSFPEQAVFYYLERLFQAKNREQVDGFEFDIFLPEEKIAVEYDGYYWHQSDHSIRMEERKNAYCSANRITLFRLKETIERDKTVSIAAHVITYRYDSANTFLNDAIALLISEIGVCAGKRISIIPDIDSDRGLILANYEQAEYEASLIQYPELVAEWDNEKNGGLKPQNVRPGSEKRVYWTCSKGHSYKTRIAHRVSGSGCPVCSNKTILQGYNDLQTLSPELASDWNYEKNKGLLPTQVSGSSSKNVWWKCRKCGWEWRTSINNRRSHESSCPKCRQRKLQEKTRKQSSSFVLEFQSKGNSDIELLGQYANSSTKIECRCKKCNHKWQSLPYNLIRGQGCPRCAKNRTMSRSEYIETLQERNLTIGLIGNYKNLTSKTEFKCLICGFIWVTTPSKVLSGGGCPSCRLVALSKGKKKPVLQYEKTGVFLQRFDSAADAASALGFKSYKSINSACQGNKKSAYGFIWVYEDEDVSIEDIVVKNKEIQHSKDASNRPRRIQQIKDGIVINTYRSANEAGRAMGSVNGSNIIACCNGKHKTAYGYTWQYVNE